MLTGLENCGISSKSDELCLAFEISGMFYNLFTNLKQAKRTSISEKIFVVCRSLEVHFPRVQSDIA